MRGPTEVVAVADEFNELVENLRRELGDRERAEQTVRDSERSYRTLFEDNPQPMWIWDVATFAFLAVNDAADRPLRLFARRVLGHGDPRHRAGGRRWRAQRRVARARTAA